MGYLIKSAIMSDNGLYRYQLTRAWDLSYPRLSVIMLNPSKADAVEDDATIRKLVGFASRADYGRIDVYNLFAYRATNPRWLNDIDDPVGPMNDKFLFQVQDAVLCAWGNIYRKWDSRAALVLDILRGNKCTLLALGFTASGDPFHPVRLGYKQAEWQHF